MPPKSSSAPFDYVFPLVTPTTLSGASSPLTITVPGNSYSELVITGNLRGTAAFINGALQVRLNNDATAANYVDMRQSFGNNAIASVVDIGINGHFLCDTMPGNNATASEFGSFEIVLSPISNNGQFKNMFCRAMSMGDQTIGNAFGGLTYGIYKQNAVISRVDLIAPGGGNFAIGSWYEAFFRGK